MAVEEPDYVICINCETPCYVFEWANGAVTVAQCEVCGDEEPDEFVTEEDFDAMMA